MVPAPLKRTKFRTQGGFTAYVVWQKASPQMLLPLTTIEPPICRRCRGAWYPLAHAGGSE
jgi:hypothetical protein